MFEEIPDFVPLDNAKTQEMLSVFKGERTGWVQVGEKKWFFPWKYTEQGKHFYKFKARPDDTWVMSYPRSGTTWTQELVWLLKNDLDFETAKKKHLSERFPFLEFSMFQHPDVTAEFLKANEGDTAKQNLCRQIAEPGYQVLSDLPSPRFIKSHFPLSLMPNVLNVGCKIVYLARNPKDVAVSWYHLNRAIKTQGYTGDFQTFWNYFQDNLTPWSPYWDHLKEAWAKRHHPNLLFMFYEELQQDLYLAIRKVEKFLGKSYSDPKIFKLMEHLDIKNFQNNPMINSSELRDCHIIESGGFVRNGQSGAWVNTFTDVLEAKADLWIEENLKDTDLTFPCLNNNYKSIKQ